MPVKVTEDRLWAVRVVFTVPVKVVFALDVATPLFFKFVSLT
jgi:hypothetical protein